MVKSTESIKKKKRTSKRAVGILILGQNINAIILSIVKFIIDKNLELAGREMV